MSQLETKLDTGSDEFKANVEFMKAYVEKIRTVERNGRKSCREKD